MTNPRLMPRSHLFLAVAILCSLACPLRAELIFRSGFESNTVGIDDKTDGRLGDLHGQDSSAAPPNDWQKHLEADGRTAWFNYCDTPDGTPEERKAVLVKDGGNTALFARQTTSASYGGRRHSSRIQFEVRGMTWTDTYHKVRVKFADDIRKLESASSKRTIILYELWLTGGKVGSRVFVHPKSGKVVWGVGVLPGSLLADSDAEIKYNTWQTLEVWHRTSADANVGLIRVAVDGTTVIDQHTKTANAESDTTTRVHMFKVYGHPAVNTLKALGSATEVWFDDVELWSSFPQ